MGVVAAAAFATFDDYGLGWDDRTHSQMGELLLAFYGSGFVDKRALSFVNLYYYGGGFDMAAALLAKVLPFGLFETRRLAGALVGIVGLSATWRLTRLAAGPLAGLIALTLLAACPIYYGHMFINAKDAPFAAAMAILLWALIKVFAEYPRPTWTSVTFVGLGFGLVVGTRVMGGIAALYAAAALFVLTAAETRELGWRTAMRRAAGFVARLIPAALLGYVVMGALWPWSVLAPLNPLRALQYFSTFFEKPWKELYNGSLIAVPDMPWTYLPTLFALKLPEVFWLLALAGLAVAAVQALQRKTPMRGRAILALLIAAAAIPILLTVLTRPALYNGVRHFLFVLPPLAALGGLAGASLLHFLAQRSRAALAAGCAILALGVASPVVEMVRLHPFQYIHFNRIAGGVSGAEGRFMLDYWALSFKQAAQALRAKLAERGDTPPAGRRWKLAVCGPPWPTHHELESEFDLQWTGEGADFALMLGEHFCKKLPAPVFAQVERAGAVLSRVYDVRGHAFTTLYTLPPP